MKAQTLSRKLQNLLPANHPPLASAQPGRQAQPPMTASIDSDLRESGPPAPGVAALARCRSRKSSSETTDAKWDAVVPDRAEARESKVPLLAGAVITIETDLVTPLDGTADAEPPAAVARQKWPPCNRALRETADILALFKASLRQDEQRTETNRCDLRRRPGSIPSCRGAPTRPFSARLQSPLGAFASSRLGGRILPGVRRLAGRSPKCEASSAAAISAAAAAPASGKLNVWFVRTAA